MMKLLGINILLTKLQGVTTPMMVKLLSVNNPTMKLLGFTIAMMKLLGITTLMM